MKNSAIPDMGHQETAAALKHKKFRIEQLPRMAPESRWRTEAMRSYSQPLLLWFTRGRGRITVAGIRRDYRAHHAVFIPRGAMHGYEMLSQIFGTALYLPNSGKLGLPDSPVHYRFSRQQQAELTDLIDNIARELKNELPGRQQALLAHARLLSVWLSHEAQAESIQHSTTDTACRLAAAYALAVEQDFRSARSVKDYAAHLGVTPTHLTRACNAACSRSASAILADRVYFEARALLRNSQRPIKDIADELGFRSAAYFTRAFQKHTGKTPSEFRKTL